MSSFRNNRAVALKYDSDDTAPIVVASGLGYMAQKIVEIAAENNVPVYEDTSLATVLSQFQLGQSVPEELYQAIVEIYVYFLHFDPAAGQDTGQPSGPAEPSDGTAAGQQGE